MLDVDETDRLAREARSYNLLSAFLLIEETTHIQRFLHLLTRHRQNALQHIVAAYISVVEELLDEGCHGVFVDLLNGVLSLLFKLGPN